MEILDSYPKISKSEIEHLNTRLNIKLPDDYSDFLLKHNGGQPKLNHFKNSISGKLFDFDVVTLYGIGPKGQTGKDILTMFVLLCESIPGELLPIGSDGGGNEICLGIKSEFYNKVYIWWEDYQVDEGETPTFDNVELIASSFSEFLGQLK